MNRNLVKAGTIGIAVAGAAVAGALLFRSVTTENIDTAQVQRGREIYAAHCASCHGTSLEGQPDWQQRKPDGRLPAPPHDASGHTWHHSDAVLFAITRNGVAAYAPQGYESDMPGFGDRLSDDEIRAVLAYIKSTWPREIAARQAAITRQERNR